MSGAIVKDPAELVPGRWYAVGIAGIDDEIDWGGAQLLRYDGEDCWSDEEGPVELVWDPLIQQHIPVSDADAFALQA